MLRLRARNRASHVQRRAALLVALFAALVVAVALGACGTILDIAPDEPVGGDGGEGGNATGDGPATTLDGPEVYLDGALACPVSADRVKIVMGEVLAGMSRRETVHLSTASTDAKLVSIAVTGDAGFRSSTPTLVVSDTGASFDVFFDAGSGGVAMAMGHLEITYAGCSMPIAFDLLATRSSAAFAVTPGVVDLGVTACGTAPSPATLTIQAADAGSTASWTITAGAPFVAPPNGALSGGTADISIGATVLPMTPPQRFDSSLSLTIQGEATPRSIPATVLSKGGVIEFTPSILTITKPATSGSVTVKNTGNLAMGFQFQAGPLLAVTPNKVTLSPGQAIPLTFTSVGATAYVVTSVTVTSTGAGPLCSAGSLMVVVTK